MQRIRDKNIEVLFTEQDIAVRNKDIACKIANSDLKSPLVISILKGSFVFAADLIREMHRAGMTPEVEFISISSYGAGQEAGEPVILRDVETDVTGRDVILIDDILESGGTLTFTRDLMQKRGANSITIAVLLDKLSRRKSDINADYAGFECPDKFVVGYGMDSGHAFRELPFVGFVTDA